MAITLYNSNQIFNDAHVAPFEDHFRRKLIFMGRKTLENFEKEILTGRNFTKKDRRD